MTKNTTGDSPALKFDNYRPEKEGKEEMEQSANLSEEEVAKKVEAAKMGETEAMAIKAAQESKYAVGVLVDGTIELTGNYSVFTLEEGARQLRAMALNVKKGVVFTPKTEQAPQ